MSIKNLIKKNSIAFLITIIFICWMIFLMIISVLAERNLIFFDVIAQEDVSSNYSSEMPIERYLIEPFVGIAFIMTSKTVDWILILILLYIVVRIILFIIDNILLRENVKKKIIFAYIKNALDFYGKYFLIIFGTSLLILLIGFLIFGFGYVNNHFNYHLLIPMYIGFTLFIIKIIYNLIAFIHPRIALKSISLEKENQSRILKERLLSRSCKEVIYFIEILFLILITNYMFLNVRFPTQRIHTELADDEFLFDFHVHTTFSDGYLIPSDRVLWYIEQGIHGAAFSDHDNLHGSILAHQFVDLFNLDFVVIDSEEFSVQDFDNPGFKEIHLNIYGLKETIVPSGPLRRVNVFGKSMNVSDMIQYVKEQGGYVTVNHYYGNNNGPYTYEQLRDWGVDGFEVVNGDHEEAAEIRQFCLDNNLICIGGSDEHTNQELKTIIKLKLEDPNNKTVDAIFTALRKNEHEAVLIEKFNNPNTIKFPEFLSDFEVFEDFINYLLNSDKIQALSWIIWSLVFYSIIVIIIKGIKNQNIEKLKAQISKKN